MSDPTITPEERFATIVEALLSHADVTFGSPGKKGFGSCALKIGGRIFAMIDSRGEFVVKLPLRRVDALIASGMGERYDPGHGRLMKEWLAVAPTFQEGWLPLAREAMEFVASKR
jgi:hypothetical protein